MAEDGACPIVCNCGGVAIPSPGWDDVCEQRVTLAQSAGTHE